MTFNKFIKDYPALLSTCHSLRDSIADGYLLDYLIIDECQLFLAQSEATLQGILSETRNLNPPQ